MVVSERQMSNMRAPTASAESWVGPYGAGVLPAMQYESRSKALLEVSLGTQRQRRKCPN